MPTLTIDATAVDSSEAPDATLSFSLVDPRYGFARQMDFYTDGDVLTLFNPVSVEFDSVGGAEIDLPTTDDLVYESCYKVTVSRGCAVKGEYLFTMPDKDSILSTLVAASGDPKEIILW